MSGEEKDEELIARLQSNRSEMDRWQQAFMAGCEAQLACGKLTHKQRMKAKQLIRMFEILEEDDAISRRSMRWLKTCTARG